MGPFKFTNRWEPKYMAVTQADRLDLGLYGDWSDKDISARIRISKCVVFSFGFSWAEEAVEAYVCFMNFQFGLKYIFPKEDPVILEE